MEVHLWSHFPFLGDTKSSSPSSALSHLFLGEGSPTKIDVQQTTRVPTCSHLSNLEDLEMHDTGSQTPQPPPPSIDSGRAALPAQLRGEALGGNCGLLPQQPHEGQVFFGAFCYWNFSLLEKSNSLQNCSPKNGSVFSLVHFASGC